VTAGVTQQLDQTHGALPPAPAGAALATIKLLIR
jgi:hypothetical protein